MRQRYATLLSCAAAVFLVASQADAQGDLDRRIRQNQSRLDSIRDERGDLEDELQRLRGRMRDLTTEIQNIERQKHITNRIVNELDRQMSSMTSQLDTITLDLMLAQDALAEKRAVLQRRLAQIYKRGPLYGFQVLLAAESFGDLLSRYKYLYLVSSQDRSLVQEVENLALRIGRQRAEVMNVQTTIANQRQQRGQELRRFVSLEQGRQNILRQTRAFSRVTESRIDSLSRAEEALNTLVASLETARRRAIARGERVDREGAISTADLGTLLWPVEGDIIYRFGPVPGPSGTRLSSDGIGIAVPAGTPVRAVAGGIVQHVGPLSTWGPSVFIDHGGGFYTLYLYLSAFDVGEGNVVAGGQVIGRSGGAGTLHGPHIEFQIRETSPGGTQPIALDPLNWLAPRR